MVRDTTSPRHRPEAGNDFEPRNGRLDSTTLRPHGATLLHALCAAFAVSTGGFGENKSQALAGMLAHMRAFPPSGSGRLDTTPID